MPATIFPQLIPLYSQDAFHKCGMSLELLHLLEEPIFFLISSVDVEL